MTKQQRIVRHISFRYLRDLKYFKQFELAESVITELWFTDLITPHTKHLLMLWLYDEEV